MKRKLVLIVCIACATVGFAKKSDRAADHPVCADTWHAVLYDYLAEWVEKRHAGVDMLYLLDADTIVNGRTYRKLLCNNTLCGALRQTEDGMQVYYYDLTAPADNPFRQTDCLLYDFSANVGDTIKNAYFWLYDMRIYTDFMGEPQSIGWLVTDKQTIDGRIHMTVARCYDDSTTVSLQEENGLRYPTRWIQGVGTPNVLWPVDYAPYGMNVLYTLCAMHGDEMLYSFDVTHLGIENNCTDWRFTALTEVKSDQTDTRKFFRNGHIFIQTPMGIFNATGQRLE